VYVCTRLRARKIVSYTTGNWLFADCNFLCQLFFLDTRQRDPFANWNFLQSAKQDLPTARQLAKNYSRQRQAMVDAIHTVTFADCHSVSSRQRRRLCQLPSSLAVGKEFLFFLIFDPSFLCCLDTVST
jgi:hypothetical protein